jgi:hypothetical protein
MNCTAERRRNLLAAHGGLRRTSGLAASFGALLLGEEAVHDPSERRIIVRTPMALHRDGTERLPTAALEEFQSERMGAVSGVR